jgi:hypothetical protein
MVLARKESHKVVPYSVRRLTVPPASLVPRSAVPPEGGTTVEAHGPSSILADARLVSLPLKVGRTCGDYPLTHVHTCSLVRIWFGGDARRDGLRCQQGQDDEGDTHTRGCGTGFCIIGCRHDRGCGSEVAAFRLAGSADSD